MSNIIAWAKSNWVIVLPSVVVVASLPAGLLVSGGMAKGVQDELQKKASQDFIDVSKEKQTYTLPNPLKPSSNLVEHPDTLNKGLIDWFAAQRTTLKGEADAAWAAAVKFNKAQHGVIIENLFPAPEKLDDVPRRTEFANVLVSTVSARLLKQMNAGLPPEQEKVTITIREFAEQLKTRNQNMGGSDDAASRKKDASELIGRREQIYAQRAGEIKVYADAAAFAQLPLKAPA